MTDAARDKGRGLGECSDNAAAYALGALEPHEVEEFQRHLASCAICRDEVAVFEQVVGALPMAAPQLPVPRRLKRRVRATFRAEAKTARRRAGRRQPGIWRATAPRPAIAGGVVLAVAAIAVGGAELASTGMGGTRVFAATVGHAQVRVSDGRGELVVAHLREPAPGHIYEVWLTRRGTARPAPTRALFSVTSTGAGDVEVPGDLNGVSAVMVTEEPAGGSLVPTSAPVIVTPLT